MKSEIPSESPETFEASQLTPDELRQFVDDNWFVAEHSDEYDSGEVVIFDRQKLFVLTREDDYTRENAETGEHIRYLANNIYIYDVDEGDKAVGRTTITRLNAGYKDAQLGVPFISFTKTLPSHEKQGLGFRRLLLANELSKRFFDRPVSSDLTEEGTTASAASLWRRLVGEGKAEEFTLGDGITRWRFKE